LIITLAMSYRFIVHFSTSFSTTSGPYHPDWEPGYAAIRDTRPRP
jgi:hypothetical protein